MFEGLLQPTHLIIILVIVLVVFGPGKLPEVGGALGKSIKEFKKGTTEALATDPPSEQAAQSAAAPHKHLCQSCHAENVEGAKFCANCGAALA